MRGERRDEHTGVLSSLRIGPVSVSRSPNTTHSRYSQLTGGVESRPGHGINNSDVLTLESKGCSLDSGSLPSTERPGQDGV